MPMACHQVVPTTPRAPDPELGDISCPEPPGPASHPQSAHQRPKSSLCSRCLDVGVSWTCPRAFYPLQAQGKHRLLLEALMFPNTCLMPLCLRNCHQLLTGHPALTLTPTPCEMFAEGSHVPGPSSEWPKGCRKGALGHRGRRQGHRHLLPCRPHFLRGTWRCGSLRHFLTEARLPTTDPPLKA